MVGRCGEGNESSGRHGGAREAQGQGVESARDGMKTYSDVQAERQAHFEETKRRARERHQQWLQLLDELKNGDERRPIKHTQDSAHTARESVRWQMKQGAAEATDVACDFCTTELFFPTPDVVPLNGARLVTCPGCGWSGGL